MWWFVFGTAAQSLMVIVRRRFHLIKVPLKGIPLFAAFILIESAVVMVMFQGISLLPPALSGLLLPINAVIQASWAMLLHKERPPLGFILAGAAAVAGLIVMRMSSANLSFDSAENIGFIFLLGGFMLMGANASLFKIGVNRGYFHPESIAPVRAFFMIIIMFIFAKSNGEFRLLSGNEWILLPIGGLVGAMHFYFNLNGIKKLPISIFSLNIPLAGFLLFVISMILFREPPQLTEIIGGFIVIAAAVAAARSLRKGTKLSHMPNANE